jgi:serine/threonine protein kinase/beta-lactam-binding protein with PASTA domain
MVEPRRLGGRYELGDVLGYGGMAEVHRGRDVRLGRDVAIKMLRVDLARDPSFLNRFRREAQSAASLNHPSIVAVYDTGEDVVDGLPVPYIVMEYVEGRTLRQVLDADQRILPTRALEITAGILGGLDYSHRNGIIHRDIKPGNVMLTPAGDVKVMDFGIARAVAQGNTTMTQTAAVIGTAQYLSPEQARGQQVDPRSDVYSTGCLLYELLTGTPPFTGDSAVSVAYQHVREDPIPPSQLNPDISPSVDAIVLKAMAKNPANRYQSAAEMRDDIERALRGAPIEATPLLAAPTEHIARIDDRDDFAEDVVRRQPRGRRGLVYLMIALLSIAVVIGVALLVRSIITNQHGAASGVVPQVVNESQTQATADLKTAGFEVAVLSTASTIAAGTVLSESPPGHSPLVKGATVTISVSSGPGTVNVPNIENMTLADAKNALRLGKLTLGTQTPQNSQLPAGTIISQTPASGQSAKSGSAVNVVVASGTGNVPDVRNLPQQQAEDALTAAGFVFKIVNQPNGTLAVGTVINQSPGHDTTLKIGQTVTIYLAAAPVISSPPVSPASSAAAGSGTVPPTPTPAGSTGPTPPSPNPAPSP